jgi:hypothetical protein
MRPCSFCLEGAELGVDVLVGALDERLRVVARLRRVLVGVALLVEARAPAEELLAAAVDRADGLGEDDLEVGELGVDVVVGLGADLVGLAAGLGEDAVGLVLGLPGDLGVGDQGTDLGAGGPDDLLGLAAGLLDQLLAAADEFLRLGEGAGKRVTHLFEHGEQLGAVDHAGRRHGHGAGALDHFDDLVELLLHVHRGSPLSTADWRRTGTTVRPVRGRPTPDDGLSVSPSPRAAGPAPGGPWPAADGRRRRPRPRPP